MDQPIIIFGWTKGVPREKARQPSMISVFTGFCVTRMRRTFGVAKHAPRCSAKDVDALSRISQRRGEGRAGRAHPIKMLNMKVDPEMYMKTKDRKTICPMQKVTFLHSCTAFYTKTHDFFSNCRLSYRNSSAGE